LSHRRLLDLGLFLLKAAFDNQRIVYERENAMKTEDTTKATLKNLTLQKETLRRLTPSELRLVAGGGLIYSRCC